MKKIYLDRLESKDAISVFIKNAEVIPAGATLYTMSVEYKNEDYQKYEDNYDLKFIFDNDIPQIDFYTVPRIDIFAQDSLGGLFGTIGEATDIDNNASICYINKNKECFSIADSLKAFLKVLESEPDWRKNITPNNNVTFYKSREDAMKNLEFLEIPTKTTNQLTASSWRITPD
jgi:hypothetical protein